MSKYLETFPIPLAGRPPSAQAQVLDEIRRQIADRRLPPGAVLPSVRALAKEHDFDPGTVQRAYRELQRLSVVGRRGAGTRSHLVVNQPKIAPLAGAIAVLTQDSPLELPNEPGWSVLELRGTMQEIQLGGATVLLVRPQEFSPDRLLAWHRDGLVGVVALDELPERARHELDSLRRQGLPVVALTHVLDGLTCDRVGSDHHAGGRMLCEHLIAQGSRRFAALWPWSGTHPDQKVFTVDRLAGIHEACKNAGLEPPQRRAWFTAKDPEESLRSAIGQIFDLLQSDSAVDTLLVHTDGDVKLVHTAVQRCVGSKNQRIVIAGYDNYLSPYQTPRPAVTVDKRNAEIGAELVRLLRDRAAGRLTEPQVTRLLMPRLITG